MRGADSPEIILRLGLAGRPKTRTGTVALEHVLIALGDVPRAADRGYRVIREVLVGQLSGQVTRADAQAGIGLHVVDALDAVEQRQ